jgi:hypothetical protein
VNDAKGTALMIKELREEVAKVMLAPKWALINLERISLGFGENLGGLGSMVSYNTACIFDVRNMELKTLIPLNSW